MKFKHTLHDQILRILQAVNQNFFKECSIAFGGGTMLALAYGEYRLSRDIDFLCPYGHAFSRLRRSIFDHGYEILFDIENCNDITFPREMRADRDGVRFAVQNGDTIMNYI